MSSPRQCEIEKVGAAQKRRSGLAVHIILFKFGQKEAKQWDIKAAINCLARALHFSQEATFLGRDRCGAASSAFCARGVAFVCFVAAGALRGMSKWLPGVFRLN
jgi:hypothetical protein